MSHFIRVYRLPEQLTNGFCHGDGVPITFLNVDWFNLPEEGTFPIPDREQLIAFIKGKRYYSPSAQYLVLDDRLGETFVIEKGEA